MSQEEPNPEQPDVAQRLRTLKAEAAEEGNKGNAEKCRQLAEQRVDLAVGSGNELWKLDARSDLGIALQMGRHADRAIAVLESCERVSRRLLARAAGGKVEAILRTAWKKTLLGLAMLVRDEDPERALSLAREVKDHCAEAGDGKHYHEAQVTEATIHMHRAEARRKANDTDGASRDDQAARELLLRADKITIDAEHVHLMFCPDMEPAAIDQRFRVNQSACRGNLADLEPERAEHWLRRALEAVDGLVPARATAVRIRLAGHLMSRDRAEAAAVARVADEHAWAMASPESAFAAATLVAETTEMEVDREAARQRAAVADGVLKRRRRPPVVATVAGSAAP